MAQKTNIEWAEFSWNFLRGCRRVSEGCTNCYAERQAIRHAGPGGSYEGLAKSTPKGPRWTGDVSFHENILLEPLKRKKPTRYFVNSMSDLFYEKVTDEMLDKAFAVMALCPQHTFQCLTKRPERMMEYFARKEKLWLDMGITEAVRHIDALQSGICHNGKLLPHLRENWYWDQGDLIYEGKTPLPNVHLGVSVEDQKTADERIPLLLQTPAAVRWVSAEPLIGPVNLAQMPVAYGVWFNCLTGAYRIDDGREVVDNGKPVRDNRIDWIIAGGESGPGARPCDIAWIRSIVEQCKAAGVPVFVKQVGAKPYEQADNGPAVRSWGDATIQANGDFIQIHLNDKKGGDITEWPEDLRVREFPTI